MENINHPNFAIPPFNTPWQVFVSVAFGTVHGGEGGITLKLLLL